MTANKFFLISLLFISFTSIQLPAQNAKDHITKLIRAGNIEEARTEVEKYLKKDPANVDALMMMGNVILNEYFRNAGHGLITVTGNNNESIFDRTIGFIKPSGSNYILPKSIAMKVGAYWERCLKIDNKRKDIHFGACHLYSTALMKEKLKTRLAALHKTFPKEKLMYVMGDYARNLYHRGEFDMAIEVYKYILAFYPYEAGIHSDVAALFFKEGRIKNAEKYVNLAFKNKNPDFMVFDNYFMIHLMLSNYDKALAGIKRIKKHNLKYFYEGLILYYKENTEWKNSLENYLKLASQKTEKSEIQIATYLLSNKNKHDYQSFKDSLIGGKYLNYLILTKRAMKKFPEKFEPYYLHAKMLTYYKYYDIAIGIYKTIEKKNLSLDINNFDNYNFLYAWALQDSSKFVEAGKKWKLLLNSKDFYIKSAACYFYGKFLFNKGQKEKAFRIFKKVSEKGSDSKYATYCWNYLKRK